MLQIQNTVIPTKTQLNRYLNAVEEWVDKHIRRFRLSIYKSLTICVDWSKTRKCEKDSTN